MMIPYLYYFAYDLQFNADVAEFVESIYFIRGFTLESSDISCELYHLYDFSSTILT